MYTGKPLSLTSDEEVKKEQEQDEEEVKGEEAEAKDLSSCILDSELEGLQGVDSGPLKKVSAAMDSILRTY